MPKEIPWECRTVYVDANDNQTLDADEYSTTTDSNGTYSLTAYLDSATCIVREVLPDGWHPTVPSGGAYSFPFSNGQLFTDIDFASHGQPGGLDPSFGVGDTLDWLARAEAGGVKIGSVEELVLRRRIHGENTTVREKDKQSDYLRVLKAVLDRRRFMGQEGAGR